jgi:hypothetical protein
LSGSDDIISDYYPGHEALLRIVTALDDPALAGARRR